jgi:glycosyltransferase involved in cell wall biosynthesis
MTPRVAFDVGPLQGRRTGIGRAVAALADAIAERDDVDLQPFVTSFRARPEAGTRRLPLPAVAAHRLWGHLDRPRVDRWLGSADLVHGTNYVVPPSRLPRLVSVYDCWFLLHPDQAHPAVVRAGTVLARSIAAGATVHCSSDATAATLRRLFPGVDTCTVHLGALPLAAPPTTCPIPELDGPEFVLSTATLERRKNLPRLIEAFGLLAHQRRDVRLVLAGGDGDDRPRIEAAIDALDPEVSQRVLLTGFVDDAVRSWLLHHARVLAYPSLDEGFGFPLLDAMQAHVPVVAARAGSIPEVAGDAAVLVPVDDTSALAEALHHVLDDDAARARLVAAGLERVATFTWHATAASMASLYRRLGGSPT